jgi:hypothetical protein
MPHDPTITPDRAPPEVPDQSLRPVHQNQRGKSKLAKEIEADRQHRTGQISRRASIGAQLIPDLRIGKPRN